MSCDVLVVGGGSAGIAAAVAAARAGAETLLVEQSGMLGGTATASLIHSICGLYRIHSGAEAIPGNRGFALEFAENLLSSGGARGPLRMGRVDVLLIDPSAVARLADEITTRTPHLRVWLHSQVIQVSPDLAEVVIFTRGRLHSVQPRALIDTTGDGTAGALAGLSFEQETSDRLQRPAYIYGLHGVGPEALVEDYRLKLSRHLVDGVRSGLLPETALGASFRESGEPGGMFVSIDLPAKDFDPLDPTSLTALEIEGRALASRLSSFLKNKVPGFEASFTSRHPARIGIRESRRLQGQYRLETSDVENGLAFPDGIAVATWPMELREKATGPKLRYPVGDQPVEIPLRSLRAAAHDSFFMAGRCLSCSHEAQASIRVIGTCLATGQASGLAAAQWVATRLCDPAIIRSQVV